MASLELLIEPGGLVSGASVTRSALDQIIAKGAQAENAIGRISETTSVTGASMQEAFGAAKGGLKITQGLAAVTNGFVAATTGAQNFASVANNAAGLLLNFSRTRDEWLNLSRAMETTTSVSQQVVRDQLGVAVGLREVTSQTRQATSGWGVLWTTLKANPISAIVTAIGLAATAMSVFSTNTGKAADNWADLGQAMERARLDERAARELGADVTGPQNRQLANILASYSSLQTQQGNLSLAQVSSASGIGGAHLARYLAEQGNLSARNYVQEGRYLGEPYGRFDRQKVYSTPDELQFTPEQAREVFRRAYSNESSRIGSSGRSSYVHRAYGPFDPVGFADPNAFTEDPNYLQPGQGVRISREQQADVTRENMEEAQRAMDEMLAKANQFGATLGDAFFNAATGAQSLRQSLAQILSDFARIGAQKAFGAIFEAVAGGFAKTPTQKGGSG